MRSVVFFVLTVGLEMTLGVTVALACQRAHPRARGSLMTSLMLLPMFMAPVIVGLLGRFLTDSTYGLYAWFLRETHIYSGDILGSTTSSIPGGDADGRVGVDAADRADRAGRSDLGAQAGCSRRRRWTERATSSGCASSCCR